MWLKRIEFGHAIYIHFKNFHSLSKTSCGHPQGQNAADHTISFESLDGKKKFLARTWMKFINKKVLHIIIIVAS